jgi:hypothetical protein
LSFPKFRDTRTVNSVSRPISLKFRGRAGGDLMMSAAVAAALKVLFVIMAR